MFGRRPARNANTPCSLARVRSEERKQDAEIDSVGHAVIVQVGLGIVRSPEGQEDPKIASADDAIVVEVALGIAAVRDIAGDLEGRGTPDADLYQRVFPHIQIDEVTALLFGFDER